MPAKLKTICRKASDCVLDTPDTNSLHPVLKTIYQNRQVKSISELDVSLNQLHSPSELKGIEDAVYLLFEQRQRDGSILILGDYDTDGATASVVGIRGLKSLGFTQVSYLVPNRFEYGYGLSTEIAEVAIQQKPDLVITVDNGISSVEGVQRLRDHQIEVIITDHHLPGPVLPEANAIVNPNQHGCHFPSKSLSGVGVMFYLLLHLRKKLRDAGCFDSSMQQEPNLAVLLDLVALGTVADLVPMDHNNRVLVSQGLARIKAGQSHPGIMALFHVAGKSIQQASSQDLGFYIAPRLNAAGRLDDISIGVECLLTDQYDKALELAEYLHQFNLERRKIEQSMQSQAIMLVKDIETTLGDESLSGLCLFDESWHQGITGLVASRIKDQVEQPVIAFAPINDGLISGSARSIQGIHIRDLLEQISTTEPGLIHRFGGHAMAAGLTIQQDSLIDFRTLFSQAVKQWLTENEINTAIESDGSLQSYPINIELAELIRFAAPWGQGFPAPIFDDEFDVIEQKIVGQQHLKLVLQTKPMKQSVLGSSHLDAICFRYCEPGESTSPLTTIRAVYQLDINEFRGNRSVQLLIQQLEKIEPAN